MLDLKEIRNNLDGLRRAVRMRRVPGDKANVDRWIELDLKYIDDWSLALDLSILLKTVPAVVRGTGAV